MFAGRGNAGIAALGLNAEAAVMGRSAYPCITPSAYSGKSIVKMHRGGWGGSPARLLDRARAVPVACNLPFMFTGKWPKYHMSEGYDIRPRMRMPPKSPASKFRFPVDTLSGIGRERCSQ